jgi:RES domain-containing protein
MRVFRLTRAVHANLDGEGARLHGGRWTSPGRRAVYVAGSASLALLEVLVHLDLTVDLLPDDYVMMEIDVPETVAIEHIEFDRPPDAFDFRAAGDAWLDVARTAFLSVPSMIVPQDRNGIINPAHPDAAGIVVIAATPFRFDPRLAGPLSPTGRGLG